MGRCTMKLNDGERDWYLRWSTVVDAPVTDGMSRKAMLAHLVDEMGSAANAINSLERADLRGVSWVDGYADSVEQTIASNRAGDDESELTLAQIIAKYCKDPQP